MRNIPHISRTERTVQDISNRARQLREEAKFNINFMEDLALTSIVHEDEDPKSVAEALSRPNGPLWKVALDSELKSMHDHHVWDLVPRTSQPIGKKVIKSKTICHIKRDELGNMAKLKARFVAKEFTQIAGEDYHDTCSPVGRMESLRLLLSIAATLDWDVKQLDVKTAFLHSELDEEIYMEQPEGGIAVGYEDHICKLRKGIYGLKQAGRQWNKMLDKTMLKHGFKRIPADHCLYMRITSRGKSIIVVHTDDMAAAASTPAKMESIIHDLRSTFDIMDLGEIKWMLGIEISQNRENRTVSLCQSTYIERIVKRFNLESAPPVWTPLNVDVAKALSSKQSPLTPSEKDTMSKVPYRAAIGSIMYTATCTRPDIAFSVNKLAQFSLNPGITHWSCVKQVISYLKATKSHCLVLGGSLSSKITLRGSADSDYASNIDTHKSVSGYAYFLGLGAISWSSKKQATIATSSCKAEYVSACHAAKEAIWLQSLLNLLGYDQDKPTSIQSDNMGTITIIKDPSFHVRTKHIDIQHHYVREHVKSTELEFTYTRTSDTIADILTKALP